MNDSSVKLGYVFYLALAAALGGLLFGYDTAVISGTIDQVTSQFSLSVLQQGWYVGCALIGSIIGVAFAGWLSDKIGRKPAMFLSAILFTVSAIGCAITPTFNWLVIYGHNSWFPGCLSGQLLALGCISKPFFRIFTVPTDICG